MMKEKRKIGPVFSAVLTDLALAAIVAGLFLTLSFFGSGRAVRAAGVFGGAVYTGRNTESVALVLTADWDAASMDELLACLDASGAKITVALGKNAVNASPALVRRIAAAGHELAVLAGSGGAETVLEDAGRTAELIESLGAERPKLLVFAGDGSAAKRAAAKLGMTAVAGTLDLLCVRGTAEEITRRAAGNTNGGDIVLCAPTAAFAEALPRILEYYSGLGLTAGTVSGTIYD